MAIKTAVESSEDNAVILIAGKGHENYQEINGVRSHFSDKEVAKKYC
jgi:UDP-N-acetylmuramoyl-L-alanyl-D-glutamate--2,6-diaminopimelate ligase